MTDFSFMDPRALLFGGAGMAESPIERILKNSKGFTPGINPNAPDPREELLRQAQGNNFGGPSVQSTVSPRRISATADRQRRGERPIERILGALGGPGRAVRDFASPVTNALGTVADVARDAAMDGSLNTLAPNFSAGVQAAAQREIDNALKMAQIQASTTSANRPQRRVQSAQILENGNIGYIDAFTGDVVDTGQKSGNRSQVIDVEGQGKFIFNPVTESLTPLADEATIQEGLAGRKGAEVTGSSVAKAKFELPVALAGLETQINDIDFKISDVQDAIDLVRPGTTGWANALAGNLPATDARALRNAIDTVKGSLAFGELQKMRNASKTGGALGNVSERELDLLERSVETLDPLADSATQARQLAEVMFHYENTKRAMQIMGNALAEQAGEEAPFTENESEFDVTTMTDQQLQDIIDGADRPRED